MEGPNPLRPYYIPPSAGSSLDYSQTLSSPSDIGSKHASATTTTSSFGSSARNILADMDYTDYLSESSPSSADIVKRLLEQALWKYTSVFLAQPFEVAKTVLQVQLSNAGQKATAQSGPAEDSRRRPSSQWNDVYEVSSSETYHPRDPADSPSRRPLMILTRNRHPILPLPLRYPIHRVDLLVLVGAEIRKIHNLDPICTHPEVLTRRVRAPRILSRLNLLLPC